MTTKAPVYQITFTPPFDNLFHVTQLGPDSAAVGTPVEVHIRVSAPRGIKWIRLYYRAVNQQLDYKDVPMEPDGSPDGYKTVIQAVDIDPTYDLMYYIALMDKDGHGRIYPDINKETPYRIIKLKR